VARAIFAAALLACFVSAQQQPPPEPPEEDESLAPRVYALNPVQAKKEISAGDSYYKKPNYRAAANRYLEATRWDPGSAEAFRKLGDAREKLQDYAAARDAYSKYIQLAEDPKEKDAAQKKMDKWPDAQSKTAPKK
jgi:tetratricopeptide (TPR) repeat protein